MYFETHEFFGRHAQSTQNALNMSLSPELQTLDVGDPQLTPDGRVQARALTPFLLAHSVEYVVHADNTRSRQTAEIACSGTDMEPIADGRLDEICWGSDAGRRKIEVFTPETDERALIEGVDFRLNTDAETMAEVHHRMAAARQEYQDGIRAFITSNFTGQSYFGIEMDLPRQQIRKRIKMGNAELFGFDLMRENPLISLFQTPQP